MSQNVDFLYRLRESFNEHQILLCFNGPMSRSLIEEIGKALKNYLAAEKAHPSSAMDVFAVYIEMTQNIRHYAQASGYDELTGAATVLVARDGQGHYVVQAGNLVERTDGERLLAQIQALAQMDAAQMKAEYKAQLRKPRDESAVTGAGLGLLDMARKAVSPLQGELVEAVDGRCFFSLRVVVG